ncbi:hypothetical protein FALCPG4_010275 [Fusarium falciforme]
MEAALDTAEKDRVKRYGEPTQPQLNLAENGCSRRPKLPKSGNSFPRCIFPAVFFQKGCLPRPVMDDAAPKDDAMDESLPSRQSKSKSKKQQIKAPAPKPSFSFGERKEHSTQAQPSCMETNFPISAGGGGGGGGGGLGFLQREASNRKKKRGLRDGYLPMMDYDDDG